MQLTARRRCLTFEHVYEYASTMAIAPLVAAPPLAALDGVRQIHGVLDQIEIGRPLAGPTTAAALRQVERAIARLQSVRLAIVAAADRANVAEGSGMTGTGAWLSAQTRSAGAAAAADVRLATALDEGLPVTREALAAGDVSTEHASVIAATADRLPDDLSERERTAIETTLVAQARRLDPGALRKAARRALSIAERSRAEVDAHEDSALRSEEDRAWDKARLTLHDNRDGTTSGHFTVPTMAAAILRKTVQQLASPRRFADRAAARGATTAAAQLEAFRDVDWSQRYGHAFVELLEHLPTDRLSGKVAATVVVTVEHDQLKDRLGAAHLDTGDDLSASQARRLACNAGILPAVMSGASLPLDLGRANRFFTEAQRVALATLYDTCAAADCDRPYAWSELHHHDPWASGGATDLHLAVPLCGHHHRRIHDPRYDHAIRTDHKKRKIVTYARRR
jgi:hypothetical protein